MQTSATSVVSAAVIGGDLILGLSDGSLINCGRVQGPQGLKGDSGPMGATGRDGQDGNTIHTVEGIPQASLGRDGDFAIDVTKWEIYGPRANMQWGTPTPLRGKGGKGSNERYNAFGNGAPGSGGDGSGGGGQTYTTANLPLAGTGRLVQKGGRISVPGGNIIPEANGLKYQSNLNSWSYDSLAALDEALPISTVSELPDDGKYEGDMVLFNGSLWIWSKGSWIEVGGAVEEGAYLPLAGGEMEGEINMAHNAIHNVGDPALEKDAANRGYVDALTTKADSSIQRVEDNLDLVQETVGAGKYTRKAKPQTPVGPGEGEACFLQDGGAEATTFAEVENIQLNKVGIGPYANFDSAKKGDYLLLQSAVDGDFGLYVIRNATEFGTFWDFGLEISSGKAVGTVPEIDEGIIVRTSRPTFTVAQATPPDFSATGQLWFDTAEHQLKVWDDEAQEFVGTGGGEGANVHVGELPPDEEAEGDLWYDSTRLELFVFYVDGDGNGGWVPCSPLGARVEAGEILQQQLVGRVDALEARNPDDYLKKTGGTMTGTLHMKRTDDKSYWNYIQSDTPNAWHGDNKNHGVILNIGTTNSFKQQFKIQGRSGKDLFEIHDDGAAVASLKGNLNITGQLKVDGKIIDNDAYLKKTGGTSQKMQGILYLGGHKIAGVAEPERSDDAATRQYVDNAVSSSGGGSFQTKYDGNRLCVDNALSTTTLDNGEVMYLGEQLASTTNPANVAVIGLPLNEINWDSCIKSGVIKVNNGASEAGYYQVFKTKEMSGRNMLVYVKPLWTDSSQSLREGGTPCYFQGVFFE